MSRCVILTREEAEWLQKMHYEQELERVQRVLAYWQLNPIGRLS
jgi:hypothetical protein